jgi:predicted dehydrogenase/threonine dehydrogenase-like Zn-dependent dehydrogenase
MKQVLQHVGSRRLEVADVPVPGCRAGGILVQNVASLLSAGTERMLTEFSGKSLVGKARERPDLVKQVLEKVKRDGLMPTARTVMARLDEPIPLGYSCAGVVIEVGAGVDELAVGDRVACAGMGYASHADVIFVPRNLAVALPPTVSFEDASYVTVGAIAMQGIRIAEVQLGDAVAVIGAGLLGLLTVQMLVSAGCRVIAIDIDASKLDLARALGAEVVVPRSGDVEGVVAASTGGRGADAVLITAAADTNDPIELAGRIARDRAVVTMVGAVRMDVPRKEYYEKELQLRLSRSYGPGRYDPSYEEKGNDYPIGYVRWTERRNMAEFIRLVGNGSVTPSALTTHRFPIERGQDAYALIRGETGGAYTGVVLQYTAPAPTRADRAMEIAMRPPASGRVGLGVIGAGKFASAMLLPRLAKRSDIDMVMVTTSSGASAKTSGEKFKFRRCGTDSSAVLADDAIHAVVIATRHGSHARLAAQALRGGKTVFVEKPLALDETQLREVIDAQRESAGRLVVGFNRRFSPLATQLRDEFKAAGPLAINYRVNAGPIPASNWIFDPNDGGGRIVGEVCHFIDVLQFLTGDLPVEVHAISLGGDVAAGGDSAAITLRFGAGSVATISYFTTGDKSFSKERIEVYGGGAVGVLDDWRSLAVTRVGKARTRKLLSQDKGYDGEIDAFVAASRGAASPVSMESLIATTRATFAAVASLREGRPIQVTID